MKTSCKLAIFFSFLLNFASSQTFQRTFGTTGSETGTCIQNTLDGNYIMSGMVSGFSNGYEDFYLSKMNSAGGLLWSKAYGGTYKEKNYYVSTCSDGGFILTGLTYVPGNLTYSDLYLIRTDSDGTMAWSQVVGGSKDDHGWYVNETNDGGFLAVGSTKSYNTKGDWDGYMVKLNSAGTLLWTKVFGGSNDDWFNGMNNTSDGGHIITGVTGTNTFGSSDIWLVKTDSAGDTLWTKQYGKNTEDAGNAVIQTADGGFMIVGDIHIQPNAGNHNACLLKTDATGNMEWVKTYGSNPGSEIGWAVRQTPDNGYILAGSSGIYGNGGGGDFLLVRTNSTGNMVWSKAYGSTRLDDMWYFHKTPDEGNMIIGGYQSMSAGTWDILVVNTDSLGNSFCNTTAIIPEVNSPVLQSRSGTFITTGGASKIHNTLTYSALTQSNDPCALVSVADNESSLQDISVYPNPFMEKSTIRISGTIPPDIKFKLFNMFGQEIYPILIKNSDGFTIYRGNLSSGLYLYKLESMNGIRASGKLIIR